MRKEARKFCNKVAMRQKSVCPDVPSTNFWLKKKTSGTNVLGSGSQRRYVQERESYEIIQFSRVDHQNSAKQSLTSGRTFLRLEHILFQKSWTSSYINFDFTVNIILLCARYSQMNASSMYPTQETINKPIRLQSASSISRGRPSSNKFIWISSICSF